MEWIITTLDSIVLLFLLCLPTAFILMLLGRGKPSLLLTSPIFAFASLGLLTILSTAIEWGWILVACAYILLIGCSAVGVCVRHGSNGIKSNLQNAAQEAKRAFASNKASAMAIALGVATNTCVLVVTAALGAGSPNELVQVYDNPFHLSVIRDISETGHASPIGAGSVAGGANSIYPDLWHSIVALSTSLFGGTIQGNVWIVVVVLFGLIAPIGMCLLVHFLFPRYDGSIKYFFAAAGCIMLPRSLFTFITFGSLYTNLSGLSLLPMALALCIQVLKKRDKPRSFALQFAIAVAASTITLGLFHPNIAILFFVFLASMLFAKAKTMIAKAALVVASVGVWVFMYESPLFSRTVNCLDRIGYSSQLGASLFGKAHVDYGWLASIDALPCAMFAAIIAIGLAASWALRRKWSERWYLFAWCFTLGLALCSLFPTNAFAILVTGFWYRDAVRFITFAVFLAIPAISIVPAMILGAVAANHTPQHASTPRRFLRAQGIGRPLKAVSLLVFCILFVGLGFVSMRSNAANLSKCTTKIDYASDPFSLDSSGRDFISSIADTVGNECVLNSNIDQSTWLYPQYGINALIKAHPANYMASMPDDVALLVKHIDSYAEDSDLGADVRRAATSLEVRYVVQMSNLGATVITYDGKAVLYEDFDAIARISDDTPGFELCYEANEMRLFRLVEV